MATLTAIEKLQRHQKRIADGRERVKPGMPFRITEAASVGDGVWQGDLCLVIADAIPTRFVAVAKPGEAGKQLVPGSTQGARHCLDSLDGVKLFRPENWNGESLEGPCFVLAKERTVLHPTHGAVTIPAGFTVQCFYQREYDAEQKRERRARD